MGGLSRLLAMLAAVALLALGVAACGGGSMTSTGSGESGSQSASGAGGDAKEAAAGGGSEAAQAGESQGSNPSSNNAGSNGGSSGSGGESGEPSGGGSAGGSGGSSKPHHDSGGGAAQFRTRGGDNSIQEFGGEAGGSELDQAAAALHAYLDDRAAEEWGRACDNMASGVSESLRQLAGGANGTAGGPNGTAAGSQKTSCADILAGLSAGLPPSALREAAQADVGALRIEGERAFLLFHGAHGMDYFMPMAREGGEWKVAALAASALS